MDRSERFPDSHALVADSSPVIGRTLAHYRIEELLGAGGMGSVFRARDLALGRDAAIKVVADELDPVLRERLLREAETGARLQHPAIATFYEAGRADGLAFIAMEYVRGVTLRERLAQGPLPAAEAVAVVSAVLEALHHAHTTAILHRDIKPENVMLTESGTPKLLDFGLAKALATEAPDETETWLDLSGGRIPGTIGYMSPEQLQGRDLDARSDLFAVGAVLYELVAGRPAFPGATATERIAAILTRDPAPLMGANTPSGLNPILQRALARDREDRYRSASAFLSDLRGSISSSVRATLPQTLAVLDLRNHSGQPEDDWIGSGIADTLTADLARVAGLTVVSRDKVLKTVRQAQAAGSPDPLEVGALLGCRWVLSGGYQRLGPAVRITTTLTEVGTGRVSASEKLDGTMDGIFEMQDRLSQAVIASLAPHTPAVAAQAQAPPSLSAFECYAKGRRLFHKLEKGTFEQARELYERAIEIDPLHAGALSGLAGLHAMRFTFTTDPAELERAAGYARRSIAADPGLGESHVWLGYALMRQNRMDEALEHELKGFELDPANGHPPYFAGCIQQFRDRPADAIPFFQRAVTLDPPHAFAWLALGWAHLSLGALAEARWCLETAIELEQKPGTVPTPGVGAYLGECLRISGKPEEARSACLTGLEQIERSDHMYRDSFRAVALCSLARAAWDTGDRDAAAAALQQVVAHLHGRPRTLGGGFLMVQALAGLARVEADPQRLDEANALFGQRDRFSFSILWTCSEDVTLVELGRTAIALGRPEGARMIERARDLASYEARVLFEKGEVA